MISRKKFLKTASLGAISTFPLANHLLASGSRKDKMMMPDDEIDLRIGIIGAENSHSWNFGAKFNIEQAYPGARVTHIWGETDEFAKISAKKGQVRNIVKDPLEMLGHIDALVVDHRDGKYHLDAAAPFIEKQVPTFIDKPFCIKSGEAKAFLKKARKYKTPVTSLSTVAYTRQVDEIKRQVEAADSIGQVVIYGPGKVHSIYSGLYYYAVHCLQTLTRIFGEAITRVRISGSEKNVTCSLEYNNGFLATMVFIEQYYGFLLNIETNKGMLTFEPTYVNKNSIFYDDVVNMFRTGKEPRAHESIIREVAILEAMASSLISQEWVDVNMP